MYNESMLCDLCKSREAEYFIKKTPPGMEMPRQQLHLCSKCAGEYLKHDTVSIVRIKKEQPEDS